MLGSETWTFFFLLELRGWRGCTASPFCCPVTDSRPTYRVMTRPPRNSRRAYDADDCEIEIPPMSLGNMREHGVRSVLAICQEASCGHSASINVDSLPDGFLVPDVALRLRCSACGTRNVKTQPEWREGVGLGTTGRAFKGLLTARSHRIAVSPQLRSIVGS
jgi:hypothetical protein